MDGNGWPFCVVPRLVVAVAGAALLMAVLPGVLGAVETPEYSIGQHWVYDLDLNNLPGANETSSNITLEGRVTYRVEGVRTVDVGGQSYSAYELSLTGEGTIDAGDLEGIPLVGDWSLSGTEHWEKEGLELVQTQQEWLVTSEIPNPFGGGTLEIEILLNLTLESRIIDRTWGYPYDVGAFGSVAVDVSATLEMSVEGFPFDLEPLTQSGATTFDVECVSRRSVTVPAGTFDSYEVRREEISTGFVSTDYYSEAVGNWVKREQLDLMGEPVAVYVLVSFGEEPQETGLGGLPWFLWLLVLGAVIAVALALYRRRVARASAPPPSLQASASRELPPPPDDEPWTDVPCTFCGHPLNPWAKFCPNCGGTFW